MRTAQLSFGDSDVRPALRSYLQARYASNADTILIEELGLSRGQVRVDIAVVNGQLHGFEIKSDRDTLRRLDGQVALYSKVFDRATLVVGDRHLAETIKILPNWWGVLRICTVKARPRFKIVRRGRTNPRKDPRLLVELLWLDDAKALLAKRNALRGARGKSRRLVWDRVCEHFTIDEIAAAVRATLKARSTRLAPARLL